MSRQKLIVGLEDVVENKDKCNRVALWAELCGMKKNDLDTVVSQLVVAITEVYEVYYLGIFGNDEEEALDGYIDVWWMNCMLKALTEERSNFDKFLTGVYKDVEKHFPGLLEKRLDSGIEDVIKSNFSKFDTNLDDALRTKKKYEELGVATYYIENQGYYVTFCLEEVMGLDDKYYNKDKVLKSVNFVQPHQ